MLLISFGVRLAPTMTLATLFLAGTPCAQLAADVVLPAGASLVSNEGNDKQIKLFGSDSGQFRFQQVDGDLRGVQWFSSLAFRRDGLGTYPTAFPRAAEIEIVMGEGVHGAFSTVFDDNYRAFTRNVVHDRAFVSLPDLRTPPVVAPDSFMPAIPFNHAFYYTASTDLVWEVCVITTTPLRTDYPLDAHKSVPEQFLLHRYGIGCVANPTLPLLPMSLASPGVTYSPERFMDLNFYVDRAPPMSVPLLLWGVAEQQVAFPGLCTNLYVDPMLATPMPQANIIGTSTLNLRVPYIDALAGHQVCHQAIAYDPNQPFAIKVAGSNGTSVEVVAPMPRVKSISAPTARTVAAPAIDHGFGIVVKLGGS